MSGRFLPGQVISYPYLWAWQHERGETEGRKSRPTCVVIAVGGARDGLTPSRAPGENYPATARRSGRFGSLRYRVPPRWSDRSQTLLDRG